MQGFTGLMPELIRQRAVIMSVAKRDFQRQYIVNRLGMFWAIADPISFVVIMYLVFSSAFGGSQGERSPFIVYILCGKIAFDQFSNLPQLTNVIMDHNYLVKKMNFSMEVLPAGRLVSNLMLHGLILTISIIVILLNNIHPTLYWFQVTYYAAALSALIFGISLLTSSVAPFFPDLTQIVGILTRILFFLTPVFWRMEYMPETTARLLKLNPMLYIVNGYRDSLIYGRGFWNHPYQTLYFWSVTAVVLWLGITVQRKLRPYFAEVV
jgi:lipopolysaccharide transport system permease protein